MRPHGKQSLSEPSRRRDLVPTSVQEALDAANLEPSGVVPWGTTVPLPLSETSPRTGVYVVSLSDDPGRKDAVFNEAPISTEAIEELLAKRPELTLDGSRPSPRALTERLQSFWLPDETIVYIGLAGERKTRPAKGEVSKRVAEFYATTLGARSPHAGGWPIKTLSCLPEVFVHFAYCVGEVDAEKSSLQRFRQFVSRESLDQLRDPARAMPFANLEFPRGNAKAHGIKGGKAPRK